MICHGCLNEIGTAPVCSFCGHKSQAITQIYVHSQHSKKRLIPTKKRLVQLAIAVVSISILSVVTFFGIQTKQAYAALASAKTYNQAYNYSEAIATLQKAEHYWTLPAIKKQIATLKNTTGSWSMFSAKLNASTETAATGNYDGALQLLEGMPQDFPQATDVETKKQSYIAKKAELAAAEAAKAEADKQAALAAQQKAAQKAPTSKSASGAGKRFASTAVVSSITKATTLSQVTDHLNTFLAQYGLVASIANMPQSVYGPSTTWAYLDNNDLASFRVLAATFVDEWAKYPPEFVSASKLKTVNFVKYVTVSGQQRTAMPCYTTDNRMWYGLGAGGSIVHHEFAHCFEIVFFNTLNWDAAAWSANNPTGFTYGAGGATAYGAAPKYASYQHPIAGFVTEYGTYGIEEDRAELFSYLLTKSYYSQVKQWSASDTLLTNKINIYKAMLASHSSTMSGTYFDDVNK